MPKRAISSQTIARVSSDRSLLTHNFSTRSFISWRLESSRTCLIEHVFPKLLKKRGKTRMLTRRKNIPRPGNRYRIRVSDPRPWSLRKQIDGVRYRSEEHTSELQSHHELVC